MDVKDIKEIIKAKVGFRMARIHVDNTTDSQRIFTELSKDESVIKIILYTNNKNLFGFVYRKDYYGDMLIAYDTCHLNVALGHRVREVGGSIRSLIDGKGYELEYVTEHFSTPQKESELIPLLEYPEIIKTLPTRKLTNTNVMDFFSLMSDSFNGRSENEVDGLILKN